MLPGARWLSRDAAKRAWEACVSTLAMVEEIMGCAVSAAKARPALPQESTAAATATKRPLLPPKGAG